jgi:hypothetical protein
MILRDKLCLPECPPGAKCTVSPLTFDLLLYLTGFWERGIGAKTRKISRKSASGTHAAGAFTMPEFTMLRA